MNLLIFVVAGVLLFLAFRLLNLLSKAFSGKKLIQTGVKGFFPVVELVAWLAFAFWGALIFFGDHLYYDLIVGIMAVLLIVGLAWFVFRDILAGVLLKTEKSLEPGQLLKTPFVEGRIKKLGTRNLELVNQAGETVKIPYSRLSNELFILPPDDEDSLPHQLQLPIHSGQSPETVKKKIHEHLLAMPWVINPPPVVEVKKNESGGHELHLTFYTHIRTHALIVEEKLRELTG